jgi:hypothetical protein
MSYPDPYGASVVQQVPLSLLPQLSWANGNPYTPFGGMEGLLPPGTNPGVGMMAMMAQSAGMSQAGLFAGGLGGGNIAQMMESQQTFRSQMALQAQMAQAERQNMMGTARGLAEITGMGWGPAQFNTASSAANLIASAGPMMNMFFPDLMDQLNGPSGSPAQFATKFAEAQRYRINSLGAPGNIGFTPSSFGDASTMLLGQMQSSGSTGGFRAGQLGDIYSQLSARGYMPGIDSSGGAGGTAATPDVTKIKATMDKYLQTVNAMRDIFGDNGNPNAPIKQIFDALDALTQGGMGRVSPGQLGTMVRNTQQIATSTGLQIGGMMMLQQGVLPYAQSLGLPGEQTMLLAQQGAAFGQAFGSLGLAPVWGGLDKNQIAMTSTRLTASAAASYEAQRMAVAVRAAEEHGLVAGKGSALGDYAEKVRQGTATLMGSDAFGAMMSQAGINSSDVQIMLRQGMNNDVITQYDIGSTVRGQQPAMFQQRILNPAMRATLMQRFGSKYTGEQYTEMAARFSAAVANIDPKTLHDRNALPGALADIFAGGGLGLSRGDAETLGGLFQGAGDDVARAAGFGGLVGGLDLFNPATLRKAAIDRQILAFHGKVMDAYAPLGRGGMLSRMMGYLQDIGTTPGGEGADQALIGLGKMLGGISQKELGDTGVDVAARQANVSRAKIDNLSQQLANLPDNASQADRDNITAQINSETTILQATVGTIGKALKPYLQNGVSAVSADDIARFGTLGSFAANINIKPGQDLDAWFKGKDGKYYSDLVNTRAKLGSDMANAILNDDATGQRFGVNGITLAKKYQTASAGMLALAGRYAGGDLAKLQAMAANGTLTGDDLVNFQKYTADEVSSMSSLGTIKASGKELTDEQKADVAKAQNAARAGDKDSRSTAQLFLDKLGLGSSGSLSDDQTGQLGDMLKTDKGRALMANVMGDISKFKGIDNIQSLLARSHSGATLSSADQASMDSLKYLDSDEGGNLLGAIGTGDSTKIYDAVQKATSGSKPADDKNNLDGATLLVKGTVDVKSGQIDLTGNVDTKSVTQNAQNKAYVPTSTHTK